MAYNNPSRAAHFFLVTAYMIELVVIGLQEGE